MARCLGLPAIHRHHRQCHLPDGLCLRAQPGGFWRCIRDRRNPGRQRHPGHRGRNPLGFGLAGPDESGSGRVLQPAGRRPRPRGHAASAGRPGRLRLGSRRGAAGVFLHRETAAAGAARGRECHHRHRQYRRKIRLCLWDRKPRAGTVLPGTGGPHPGEGGRCLGDGRKASGRMPDGIDRKPVHLRGRQLDGRHGIGGRGDVPPDRRADLPEKSHRIRAGRTGYALDGGRQRPALPMVPLYEHGPRPAGGRGESRIRAEPAQRHRPGMGPRPGFALPVRHPVRLVLQQPHGGPAVAMHPVPPAHRRPPV